MSYPPSYSNSSFLPFCLLFVGHYSFLLFTFSISKNPFLSSMYISYFSIPSSSLNLFNFLNSFSCENVVFLFYFNSIYFLLNFFLLLHFYTSPYSFLFPLCSIELSLLLCNISINYTSFRQNNILINSFALTLSLIRSLLIYRAIISYPYFCYYHYLPLCLSSSFLLALTL